MSDTQGQIFPGASGSRARRVVLEFESFRDFIQAFSPIVSEDGMFVEASAFAELPPKLGEDVDFEVRLTDDFRLVHGRGEIVWTRGTADASGPAGSGVRFLDLDEPSRRLVSRLIANYEKDGGKTFDLFAVRPGSSAAAVEPEPLARREADELFAPDPEGSVPQQEELDSIAPAADEEEALFSADEVELELPEVEELPPLPEPDLPASPPAAVGVEEFLLPPEVEEEEAAQEALELPDETPVIDEKAPVVEVPDVEIDEAFEPSDESPSQAAIPDEIAQIAEELSGVHQVPPVEMPSDEDRMELAGAAKAKAAARPWRALLGASLAGIALGVAVWYFAGDRLKGLVGLDDGATAPAEVEVAQPDASAPEAKGAETAAAPPIGEGQRRARPGRAEGRPGVAGGEQPEAAPNEGQGEAEAVVPASPEVAAETVEEVERPPARPTSPATEVERILWRREGDATVVIIRLDGLVTKSSYEVVQIRQGAPREVVKIFGIESEFRPKQLDVGSPHIVRLRTGLHTVNNRGELHIVADLTGPDVAVESVEAGGRRILVRFTGS